VAAAVKRFYPVACIVDKPPPAVVAAVTAPLTVTTSLGNTSNSKATATAAAAAATVKTQNGTKVKAQYHYQLPVPTVDSACNSQFAASSNGTAHLTAHVARHFAVAMVSYDVYMSSTAAMYRLWQCLPSRHLPTQQRQQQH
jgi:hypothetical protein